jgi:hypothetical protein
MQRDAAPVTCSLNVKTIVRGERRRSAAHAEG